MLSIPTTRFSDLLAQHQLLSELRTGQLDLLRLQQSLSSGRRFSLPSEDAPAALRAIELQRLLERKEQFKSNLSTNQAYLSATDSAVSSVAGLLAEARAAALAGVDAGAGPAGRETAAVTVEQVLDQLIDIGNRQFRGRYLFAGSNTTRQPFERMGQSVEYHGDEEQIHSYSDIGVLFPTNVPGHAMFGAVSEAVQGTADLNPRLSNQTRLADLRGGLGIGRGSFALSDGTSTNIIDISSAETIGDVASLIERNPPAGRQVRATVTNAGLELAFVNPVAGDNLTVKELSQGTTASELGILEEAGVGTGPLVGEDLDPRLTLTTRLADILGVRAEARVRFSGARNDLSFEATERGPEFNDVTISFVGGGTAGAESVLYDDSNPLDKRLVITIEDGVSTSAQVVQAVNAEGTFTARIDLQEAGNDLSGPVQATLTDPAATAVTSGGGGIEFDQSGGLRVTSAAAEHEINLSSAVTIEDLLNALNQSGAALLAEINSAGDGINVRSRLSGTDFTIGENGGLTATQLGLRTLTSETRLDELHHGRGVSTGPGDEFQVQRKDGTLLGIDLAAAQTIGDVLDLINGHPSNLADAWQVTARLAGVGNGIELVTTDQVNTAPFMLLAGTSAGAEDLGLVLPGQSTSLPGVVSGGQERITGRDVRPLEVRGAFSALLRLRDALRAGDLAAIERAAVLLDESSLDEGFARAELGARQQTLDALQDRLTTEHVELTGALSLELDVDFAKAVSDYTALQAAIQTSLQLAARVSQLTLLDFL